MRNVFLWCFFGVSIALATTEPTGPIASQGTAWTDTMQVTVAEHREASLARTANPRLPSQEGVWALAGWGVALGFFVLLLWMQLKMRKREELYLNDGPDLFLLPPSRPRRRR